jgi:hypothetical protein
MAFTIYFKVTVEFDIYIKKLFTFVYQIELIDINKLDYVGFNQTHYLNSFKFNWFEFDKKEKDHILFRQNYMFGPLFFL